MRSSQALRSLSTLLCATLLFLCFPFPSTAATTSTPPPMPSEPSALTTAGEASLSLDCRSAVLMDAKSGAILYEQNATEALPPASVTKIMTLLLVMEAIESGTLSLTTPITVSAYAASMGGSQVYLEEGETMSCEDMLKSVVISSANDAAVALAEHVAGDCTTFVQRMNEKAVALGMQNTHFENVTGLDDTAENHLTSARDIAQMSRALIQHKTILDYSSIWMDTIRNGAFGLSNTNRLIRFYRGATGLKTGSTEKAGFCVSATAERDGLSLICVIMGAQTRDIRNAQATRLLDWGFANFASYTLQNPKLPTLTVVGGERATCSLSAHAYTTTVPKGALGSIHTQLVLPERVPAPVCQGDALGEIRIMQGEELLGSVPIVAAADIQRVSYLTLVKRLFSAILLR